LDRLLRLSGVSRGAFAVLCIFCFAAGFVIGLLVFIETPVALVLGISAVPLPFLLVLIRSRSNAQKENEGLEGLMSNVTHAYIASNNIIQAFESYSEMKNKGLENSLRVISPVEEFIIDVHTIDPSVENGLRKLQSKINNRFFDDWISTLILCQSNRELMFALQPIIKNFNENKIMQLEAETSLRLVWSEYLTLVCLALGFIAALRYLYEVWFNIMIYTLYGRLLLGLLLFTVVATSFYMLRVTRPLD